MFKSFNKIINLLDGKRKRKFYLIIFFSIVGSFFEVFSVYSVGPFISLLTDPNIVYEQQLFNKLFLLVSLEYKYFVAVVGLFLCILVFISNILLIIMSWESHKFGQFTGSYFSQLLFNNYLSRDYLTHKNSNNSYFIKNIIYEARRCADGVIGPFTTLISKSVILLSICVSLFFINFLITISIFISLIISYLLLFLLVKKKLKKINIDLSFHEKNRYEIADNALKGIQEIKISLTQNIFKNLFLQSSDKYAYSQSLSQILAQFPRFIFETISIFLVVTFSISFLFTMKEQNFSNILPLLSMYAFAGFKIMPSLQLIYFSFATIKTNQNSINIIYNDLKRELSTSDNKSTKKTYKKIKIKSNFNLKNIYFDYSEKKILNNINFSIDKNQIVGIYGLSGSGKSTLIDIITGLIKVKGGDFFIDGKKIDVFENPEWFKNIGYLSQNIFIFDGSLKDNISFNLTRTDYNYEKMLSVVKAANLEGLVKNRDNLDQNLGYSSQKISGGEKQRVGIARALYRDTPILIFDEPTSSLDEFNEKIFRDTITSIRENRFIIIISHNKDTLSVCEKVYRLENNSLIIEK